MACPGGSCGGGKDALELRMLYYVIVVAAFGVGLLWVKGYTVAAGALTAVPFLMYFFGDRLSRGLDRVCAAATNAWRRVARRPGRRYCPACACALQAPKISRPVAGEECPSCDGSWCDSREFLRWLEPYGTHESTWLALPHDELKPVPLCPKCAVPLEAGSLERLQPVFVRCVPCQAYWLERMTWVWFEMTPPKRLRIERPAPAPAPELSFRKAPPPSENGPFVR
jgi:Zn-finger nucleic acid-binding protein